MLPPRYLRVVVSPQLELFTARKLKDRYAYSSRFLLADNIVVVVYYSTVIKKWNIRL